MHAVLNLAQRVADQLAQIDAIVAVALGGSWARSTAQPGSDLDIGIYCRATQPPSTAALQQLAQQLDDRHLPDLLTDFGGWGPWINGGGWLTIDAQPVDWLYRDLARVASMVEACATGKPTLDHQPGHPHGFHSHIYLGELFFCCPLHDPHGVLAALKAQITPYPPLLKQVVIDSFLWQAEFALAVARKAVDRNDVFYVSGCLFQNVACLVQVLYAFNERFFVNEKGALAEAETFPLCPLKFGAAVRSVLSAPGTTPEALRNSIDQLAALTEAVRALWPDA